MKKIFLVVLYKQKISESKTCISLKENNIQNFCENKIIVWDNSPEAINSQKIANEFFNSETIEFKHTPENLCLSKIYNAVIDNNQDFDFIQILDQDSKIIRENYNSYLNQVFNVNSNINIFLPKIYSNQKLYSPGKFFIKGWLGYDKVKVFELDKEEMICDKKKRVLKGKIDCSNVSYIECDFNNDNWMENLKLALLIQNTANSMYPGLFRDLNLSKSRYNQHVCDGALIVEVGATGNTLDEVWTAMKYLANVIEALKE